MKYFSWFKRKGSENKEGLVTKGVSSTSKSSRALLAPINLAIMLSVLLIGAVTIYSAPPTTKYLPGETLDPNCGPGDLNCSVELVSGGFTGVTSVDASGGSTGLSFSGGPITSGGTLTLSGTLGIGSGGTGATTASGALANLGGVPTDRLISTGVGLTGGGSLAADRTLAVVFGMTEGTVAEGNDSRIINGQAAYTWGNHADAGYLTAFSETDPSVPSHVKSIAITDIANWNTAFSWGNHADAGYLTGFTEADPTVPAYVKDITISNISNWSTAYGWGNHADAGYLTGFTEADPTVPVHVKGITSGQLTNWDNAFSWGDHSLVGYLKDFTELDPTVPAHVKAITTGNILNWNSAYSWGDHSLAGYLTNSSIDTSAKIAAIVGDEVGTGSLVFNTNPVFAGNVQLASNSYLNWGEPLGDSGLGFRINDGDLEFKDANSGGWVALNSIGGGGGSLWTLSGDDVYRDTGNVGIGTNSPTAKLSVVGDSILNGNVMLASSGYLNWDLTSGSSGYGFRDNGGVMEFKDAGGNWVALNSLLGGGGEGGSLWTLHSNSSDIFRNLGNVGINTSNPTAQFESTSDTIAAWFRGLMGESGSIEAVTNTGRYEPENDSECMVFSGHLSPDGTNLYLLNVCQGELEEEVDVFVEKHNLTTAWDVTTAESANIIHELGDEPLLDITFSSDGSTMYVLGPDTSGVIHENMGAEVYQYNLSTPWDISTAPMSPITMVLDIDSVVEPYDIQISSDGTKLFLSAFYDNGGEELDYLLVYEINTPYDISTLQEPPIDVVPGNGMHEFVFNDSGDKFFGLMPGADDGVVDIFEYTLQDPWDLSPGNIVNSEAYESIDTNGLDVPYGYMYTDFLLRSNGSGFYLTYSALSPSDSPGISQYASSPQHQGGTVLVDGQLGVGVTEPVARFESISDKIAGWFRGVASENFTPWDFGSAKRDGDYQLSLGGSNSRCDIDGVAFSSDGGKMFIAGNCYNYFFGYNSLSNEDSRLAVATPSSPDSPLSVHEYHLSVPWDINSAIDSGISYDPYDDTGFHPDDVDFSADGTKMFILTPKVASPTSGALVHEYSLSEPWSMAPGNLIYEGYKDLGNSVYEGADNFQFGDGGTKLFVSGYYTDGVEEPASFWFYDLSSPYDIDSIDEDNPILTIAPGGPFAINSTGDTAFFIFEDYVTEEYELVKVELVTPWDIDSVAGPESISFYPLPTGDEYYTDLALQPNGARFYLGYSGLGQGNGVYAGGVYQHSLSGVQGGDVIVDGRVGIGTDSPSSKLTVVGDSEFRGDVNILGNLYIKGNDITKQLRFDQASAVFRVGSSGDDDEYYGPGRYSFGFGDNVVATGEHSFAFGLFAEATGDYSFAAGEFVFADGDNSFAFGNQASAQGDNSVAFGSHVSAQGNSSAVFGTGSSWATGQASFAAGLTARAEETAAAAFGINTYARGAGSVASGYYAEANGWYSAAFGRSVVAESYISTAFGHYNILTGGNPTNWVGTDSLFAIGNGSAYNNRSNALTVLKNGNGGIGDSAYLNFGASDGVSIGETGYGFRDNAGVMEYKDLGGNWTALNSLGGEGGSIDAPLEVTSGSLAAWFRGTQSVTPWNVAQMEEDKFLEMAPLGASYYIGGGKFSSNGKKLFTIEDDGAEQRVVEYTLSTPWHISTGDSGTSYNFVNSITDPIVDIAFSDDGTMFYALSSDFTNGVYVHQYTLSAPWNVSAPIFDKTEELVVSSGTLAGATGIRFSADGSDLFMFAQMLNTTPPNIPQAFGHIVRYSLGTPWDVAAATEVANENLSSGVAPEFSSAMLFDFSTDGSKLFVGVADVDGIGGTFNIVMKEYLLDTPWDITNRTAGASKVFESGTGDPLDPLTGATPYRSFVFRPNGLAAYAVQQATTGFAGGVTQFVLKKNDSGGGDVHIDGDLAVGNVNPAFKLHITASGTGSVAGFTNDNGTCAIDPSTSSLICSSDETLKTEVLSIRELDGTQSSLERLMKLDPVSYRWNSEVGTDAPLRFGLIAQKVEKVFPELVSTNPIDGTLAVSYGGFTPFMIDAIQELSDKIDTKVFEVAVGGVEGETLGGSLVDIITRALRNAVLTVKELVTDTLRTKEICIEDDDGATCIDRKDLDELLGNKETAGDRKSEPRDTDDSNIPGETNGGEGKVEDEDEEPAPEDPEEGAKEDEGETPAEGGDDTNDTDLEGDTDPDTEPEDGGGALDDGDLVEGGDSDEGNSESDN